MRPPASRKSVALFVLVAYMCALSCANHPYLELREPQQFDHASIHVTVPAAIRREDGWVNNASVGIPSIYPITA